MSVPCRASPARAGPTVIPILIPWTNRQMRSVDQIKKLLFRLDGAADSETVEFTSHGGREWQAELCLHAGTDPQAGHLRVLFRCQSDTDQPQRYNVLPSGSSKVPEEAAEQLGEDDLRELLATSVKV